MLTLKAFGMNLENMQTTFSWEDQDGELCLVPFNSSENCMPTLMLSEMLDFLRSKGFNKISYGDYFLKVENHKKVEYSVEIKADLTQCTYELIVTMLKAKVI